MKLKIKKKKQVFMKAIIILAGIGLLLTTFLPLLAPLF